MRLSIQNILIATPIQGLFMVFKSCLYRVFPEVWISFSDKISKVNPSTRFIKYRGYPEYSTLKNLPKKSPIKLLQYHFRPVCIVRVVDVMI